MEYNLSRLTNLTLQAGQLSLGYSIEKMTFRPIMDDSEPATLLLNEPGKISLDIWLVLSCFFVLYVSRQTFLYYRFLTSETMSPFREHLNFVKHILPSFLLSLLTSVRLIRLEHLSDTISANPPIKKLLMSPNRSTLHTYISDMHGYKNENFAIATDSDERITAFRRILMRYASERLQSGAMHQTVEEGIQEWVQKGNVNLMDITMFLERFLILFLYEIDPKEVFTPEQRKKRAGTFYDCIKFVNWDAYRPVGHLFMLWFYATRKDIDPMRRKLIGEITNIWDDLYDRQMQMIKNGQKCLLGEFLKDPILANCSKDFIKANTIGAVVGGQFLTSISNVTGLLYSMVKQDVPPAEDKINWILHLISTWSPLRSVLRSDSGFILKIPCIGNSTELNRSFSLGPRQCPARGLVLELYKCMVDELAKYKFSVENLNDKSEICPVWPFTNKNLNFKMSKLSNDS